jgi:hypothetical protein
MNYYEELGISPDAPDAKIRQSYKALARLLHPDAQSDQALKAMAECQMRRLNAMLTTLLEPEMRRAYDEVLLAADPPPRLTLAKAGLAGRPNGWMDLPQAAVRQWFWILIGLALAGLVVWYLAAGDCPVAEIAPARLPAASVPENPPSALLAEGAASRGASRGEVALDQGGTEPGIVAAEAQPDAGGPLSPQESVPLRTVEPAHVNLPPAQAGAPNESASLPGHSAGPAEGEDPASWAGIWFYLPQPGDTPDAGLYVPSYIEFQLVQEQGTLAGNYRARYRIPNKALPSEVGFRAEGKAPHGNSAQLVWASDEGARGEVELTLRSANLLKVTWWTTAFGGRAGLTSGTATLVRQRVR